VTPETLAHFLTYAVAIVILGGMFLGGLACLGFAVKSQPALLLLLLGLVLTGLPVAGAVSLYLAPPAPAPSPPTPTPQPGPTPIPPRPNTAFASAVAQSFVGTKTDAAAIGAIARIMAADVAYDANAQTIADTNAVGTHFAGLLNASAENVPPFATRFAALGSVVANEQRARGITNGTNQQLTPQLRQTVSQFFNDWADAMAGLGT